MLLLHQIPLVLRISLRIMPKVKPSTLMNTIAKPRTKILVIYTAHLVLAALFHEFVDVLVMLIEITKIPQKILPSNIAVMI